MSNKPLVWLCSAICVVVASGMAAAVPPIVLPPEGLNIVTVAGTGVAGSAGNDGPATAAQLANPRGPVVTDAFGNLYFADSGNNRVREIEKTTGMIRTVVGTGDPSSLGDGGPAVIATINNPYAVAIDGIGNLYVSEFSGHRVRMVDPAGTITTYVGTGEKGFSGDGGLAKDAKINVPRELAFDHAGNLYIADGNNNCIREVDVTTKIITTVVGKTRVAGALGDGGLALDAQLASPHSLAFDIAGDLYIGDTVNNKVRKVANGIITTVVGTGVAGSAGDGGPAAAAQINQPRGIAFDSSGALYVSESLGNRVRRIDTGIISTVAGTGGPGFSGDGALATRALLNGPKGVAFDVSGNPHITDSVNNRVRRLNLAVVADINPDTLNAARSAGRWVTASVQFPAGWDAGKVDVHSVVLQAIDATDGGVRHSASNEILQVGLAPGSPIALDDTNRDGVRDRLTLKFDVTTVSSWVAGDSTLALRVEGQVAGRYFSGDTQIGIIYPPKR